MSISLIDKLIAVTSWFRQDAIEKLDREFSGALDDLFDEGAFEALRNPRGERSKSEAEVLTSVVEAYSDLKEFAEEWDTSIDKIYETMQLTQRGERKKAPKKKKVPAKRQVPQKKAS